ncbi:hypothetical protein SteCoe_8924 [Stentor coeruleus]|uniref:Uncharacterized protein n=1 Tax=Stentor coeruleus TaxID=5963 RepID=A0A1R2CJ23_9CILI|nr:hypothetical protein SteCoe_8924 [Stentor coeruleus]
MAKQLTLPGLFKDNSMQKETLKRKKISSKYLWLSSELEKVEKSRKNISFLVKIEEDKQNFITNIENDIAHRKQVLNQQDHAARVIQSKTKEIIAQRFKQDSNFTNIEKLINSHLSFLEEKSYYIFWNLGSAAYDAATTIKKAYKRAKFRGKIMRIKKVYKILTKNKKTICRITLRKGLRVFTCQIKKEHAKILKEEKERKDKVQKIRERLAIVSIKRFWKMNRITFRKYMFKCRKFKKILIKQKYLNLLSADFCVASQLSSYLSTPRGEEVMGGLMSDQETARLAALKLLKQREAQINASMISYNVIKFKEKSISPLLQELPNDRGRHRISGLHTFKNKILPRRSIQSIGMLSGKIGRSLQSIGTMSTRSASNRMRIVKMPM